VPPVIHHSSRGFFAIREENWKLVEGLGSGGFTQPTVIISEKEDPQGQLYDLEKDPGETQNVYNSNPALVLQMRTTLDSLRNHP
jgi:hypothetical protein